MIRIQDAWKTTNFQGRKDRRKKEKKRKKEREEKEEEGRKEKKKNRGKPEERCKNLMGIHKLVGNNWG